MDIEESEGEEEPQREEEGAVEDEDEVYQAADTRRYATEKKFEYGTVLQDNFGTLDLTNWEACPLCGEPVDRNWSTCPNCGQKQSWKPKSSKP